MGFYDYEVALGDRRDAKTVFKFGYNEDIDTGTEEIITSFGGSFNPTTAIMTTAQTFDVTYNSSTDGSSTTGALVLLITYLDGNFIEQTAFHTLGSTGSDTTSFTGLGINRIVVFSNGGLGWNANNIDFTASVDSTIQARVPSLSGVTQQAIFHIQIGHSFLLDYLSLSARKISGNPTDPIVTVKCYSYSRVTQTRYELINKEIDVENGNNLELVFPQPLLLSGRDVIYLTAQTTQDNTKVTARFSGLQVERP